MTTQADRIIAKFGTQMALAQAIGVGQSAVAAWKKRGFIPTRQQALILAAARRNGIALTPADFFGEADGETDAPVDEESAETHPKGEAA